MIVLYCTPHVKLVKTANQLTNSEWKNAIYNRNYSKFNEIDKIRADIIAEW